LRSVVSAIAGLRVVLVEELSRVPPYAELEFANL
jgi:hypothetical protein